MKTYVIHTAVAFLIVCIFPLNACKPKATGNTQNFRIPSIKMVVENNSGLPDSCFIFTINRRVIATGTGGSSRLFEGGYTGFKYDSYSDFKTYELSETKEINLPEKLVPNQGDKAVNDIEVFIKNPQQIEINKAILGRGTERDSLVYVIKPMHIQNDIDFTLTIEKHELSISYSPDLLSLIDSVFKRVAKSLDKNIGVIDYKQNALYQIEETPGIELFEGYYGTLSYYKEEMRNKINYTTYIAYPKNSKLLLNFDSKFSQKSFNHGYVVSIPKTIFPVKDNSIDLIIGFDSTANIVFDKEKYLSDLLSNFINKGIWEENFEFCLKNGANVNKRDDYGYLPAQSAIKNDFKALKMLYEAGADLTKYTNDGQSLYEYAVDSYYSQFTDEEKESYYEMLEWLSEKLSLENREVSVVYSNELVNFLKEVWNLLDGGKNLNISVKNSFHHEIIREKYRADYNTTQKYALDNIKDGESLVQHNSEMKYSKGASIGIQLTSLAHISNIHSRDEGVILIDTFLTSTATTLEITIGMDSRADVIVNKQEFITNLLNTADYINADFIAYCLKNGAKIKKSNGGSPLIFKAVRVGDLEALKLLYEAGADMNETFTATKSIERTIYEYASIPDLNCSWDDQKKIRAWLEKTLNIKKEE